MKCLRQLLGHFCPFVLSRHPTIAAFVNADMLSPVLDGLANVCVRWKFGQFAMRATCPGRGILASSATGHTEIWFSSL